MSDASDIKAELLVLKIENAELRRERDFYFQQVTENGERAHRAIDALNAENAKLRELCGLMFARLNTLVDDTWYPVFAGDEMTPYDVFDRYDELVQLGIEVDA